MLLLCLQVPCDYLSVQEALEAIKKLKRHPYCRTRFPRLPNHCPQPSLQVRHHIPERCVILTELYGYRPHVHDVILYGLETLKSSQELHVELFNASSQDFTLCAANLDTFKAGESQASGLDVKHLGTSREEGVKAGEYGAVLDTPGNLVGETGGGQSWSQLSPGSVGQVGEGKQGRGATAWDVVATIIPCCSR